MFSMVTIMYLQEKETISFGVVLGTIICLARKAQMKSMAEKGMIPFAVVLA